MTSPRMILVGNAVATVLVHEPRDEPWGATSRSRDFDGNALSFTQAQ